MLLSPYVLLKTPNPTGENSSLPCGSHGPERRPLIAQSSDAVTLFAVGRVFRTEAVMPLASSLGIVVELTDSVSFRPNYELAVSVAVLSPGGSCRRLVMMTWK